MNNQITFNPQTETLTYPDGAVETLRQYNTRKARYSYIQELQNALETLKVLYANPCSLNTNDYNNAKQIIQEAFDYYEANIFVEFEDAL